MLGLFHMPYQSTHCHWFLMYWELCHFPCWLLLVTTYLFASYFLVGCLFYFIFCNVLKHTSYWNVVNCWCYFAVSVETVDILEQLDLYGVAEGIIRTSGICRVRKDSEQGDISYRLSNVQLSAPTRQLYPGECHHYCYECNVVFDKPFTNSWKCLLLPRPPAHLISLLISFLF